ncbi:hypothetical protein ACLBSX_24690, partial [Pseudomonas aeruginosa]
MKHTPSLLALALVAALGHREGTRAGPCRRSALGCL